jgi:hypothetical protein
MTRTHRRIADAQPDKGLSRIVCRERAKALGFWPTVARERSGTISKHLPSLGEERPDRAAQNEPHQFFGRVI